MASPAIRNRATCVDHYAIADGNRAHGFIDISIRLRAGRSQETKKDATACIFEATRAFLASAMVDRSIALSLEMRDINPELSPKAAAAAFAARRDLLPGVLNYVNGFGEDAEP